MKLKYISTLLSGLLLISITACDDFLDKRGEPLSDITPAAFFKNVADLEAYSINLYGIFPTISGYGISIFGWDNNTDNQASVGYSARWVPGEQRVGDGTWDFRYIHQCNYFLNKVLPLYENHEISGPEPDIRHYIGEVYLMRAMEYFNNLRSYGDFPIVTELLPDKEDELIVASKRQPRHKVAHFILEDLDKAIEMLRDTPPYGKKRISRDVAYLLRSRVALYEGTWLKHHKGTAWVPGGPGWPGNQADLDGFDIESEIKFFLEESMKSAKIIGDKLVDVLVENTDTPEGMDANFTVKNPYYTMFCDINMDGYSEVLMWREYSIEQGITHNIQMQLQNNGGGSGWTRGLVNSFLMRNGLPIYASGSGFNPDWERWEPEWENDPTRKDWGTVRAQLQNRDSRIQIFTKRDGDVDNYQPDGKPNIMTMIHVVSGNNETRNVTGFAVKKGKHYNDDMQKNHNRGITGSIVFRGTEALLNYIEACYELRNEVDATADKYWRALRRRAKVDDNYKNTIANTNMNEEAKWDFGAYSKGQLVDPTLYNIRRERRCEFIGEGMRWDDLKRWRACDQLVNTPYIIEGMRYWGSRYEGNLKNNDGADMVIVSVEDGRGNMSAPTSSPYIRPYQISRLNNSVFDGYKFQKAYYLSPLGQATFRQTASGDQTDLKTSVVYQNPGWPMIAGQAATE